MCCYCYVSLLLCVVIVAMLCCLTVNVIVTCAMIYSPHLFLIQNCNFWWFTLASTFTMELLSYSATYLYSI